jgi:hypothetical protein
MNARFAPYEPPSAGCASASALSRDSCLGLRGIVGRARELTGSFSRHGGWLLRMHGGLPRAGRCFRGGAPGLARAGRGFRRCTAACPGHERGFRRCTAACPVLGGAFAGARRLGPVMRGAFGGGARGLARSWAGLSAGAREPAVARGLLGCARAYPRVCRECPERRAQLAGGDGLY